MRLLLAALILLAAPLGAAAAPAGPKPMAQAELDKFLADLPAFAKWMEGDGQALARQEKPAQGQAARLTAEARRRFREMGWEPERFFHLLDRVTAGYLYLQLGGDADGLIGELEAQRRGREKAAASRRTCSS